MIRGSFPSLSSSSDANTDANSGQAEEHTAGGFRDNRDSPVRTRTSGDTLAFWAQFNDFSTGIYTATLDSPVVPEPTSLALFGLTAAGMAGLRRRRRPSKVTT